MDANHNRAEQADTGKVVRGYPQFLHNCGRKSAVKDSKARKYHGLRFTSCSVTGLDCALSRSKSATIRAANSASRTLMFDSSLMRNERSSKFTEPRLTNAPSTIKILQCNFAGPYS